MKKVSIALVEDHTMFRKTLVTYLESVDQFSVVFDVSHGKDLFKALKMSTPEVILMDYQLPGKDGIQLTKEVIEVYPQIKVIMLSNFEHDVYVNLAIAEGASAYLSKYRDPEEIHTAITGVMKRGYHLSESVSKSLMKQIRSKDVLANGLSLENQLSQMELRVIQLMSEELTSKDISERLSKSVRTIDSYKNGIMKKTGTTNACGIIMFGIRNGIIPLDPS